MSAENRFLQNSTQLLLLTMATFEDRVHTYCILYIKNNSTDFCNINKIYTLFVYTAQRRVLKIYSPIVADLKSCHTVGPNVIK